MTTYTKKTNAKRAAIKAGIPANEVEIVEVRDDGKVRFAFKQKGMLDERNGPIDEQQAKGTQAKRKAAPAAKAKAATHAPAAKRVERNGVKRPLPGGVCARVWSWLDDHKDAKLADVRAWATKKGLNVNNAAIELYQWRRFNAT